MTLNRLSRPHRLSFASFLAVVPLTLVFAQLAPCGESIVESKSNGYARWQNGLSHDASYFPIAVWLQDPGNAAKYRAIGINLYVGLWKGPTAEQIADLKRQAMPVICEQTGALSAALSVTGQPTLEALQDVLALGDDAEQRDRQDLEHVVDLQHLAARGAGRVVAGEQQVLLDALAASRPSRSWNRAGR